MHFALLSGIFASLGSLFGKLSGISSIEEIWLLRVLCIILMLVCNGCVWTNYVKALHWSGSTISATVVSTASNYIFSALYGILIFGEATSLMWWSGLFFIISGLVLIVSEEKEDYKETKLI